MCTGCVIGSSDLFHLIGLRHWGSYLQGKSPLNEIAPSKDKFIWVLFWAFMILNTAGMPVVIHGLCMYTMFSSPLDDMIEFFIICG